MAFFSVSPFSLCPQSEAKHFVTIQEVNSLAISYRGGAYNKESRFRPEAMHYLKSSHLTHDVTFPMLVDPRTLRRCLWRAMLYCNIFGSNMVKTLKETRIYQIIGGIHHRFHFQSASFRWQDHPTCAISILWNTSD